MTGLILNANVVSEPRRADGRVAGWLAARDPGRPFQTATVIGESAAGIAILTPGRRRTGLEGWLSDLVRTHFAGRMRTYDVDAALIYGDLVATARARGRTPHIGNAQIAAVARCEGMAVSTRDVRGFEPLGVTVIDPWHVT